MYQKFVQRISTFSIILVKITGDGKLSLVLGRDSFRDP